MSELAPKPQGCVGCPAHTLGLSYVPGSGPLDAPVYMLGQGPGRTEAEGLWDAPTQQYVRAPFIGRAGWKLTDWMQKAGWPSNWRTTTRIDNTVRCWLHKGGKDLEPTPKMVTHCRLAHWGPELAAHPRVLVISVGTTAIRTTYGQWAGEGTAGSLIHWEGFSL